MRKLVNAVAALFRRDDCRNCGWLEDDGEGVGFCQVHGSRAYREGRKGLVNIGRPYKRAECRAWRAR